MTTTTERKVVQVWKCPKCGETYQSPVRASKVTCSTRHNRIIMKLVDGPPGLRGKPKPVPVLRTVVVRQEDWDDEPEKLRAKASLVSDPALLLEALGIQPNEGE